jgi:hypothetical protein
MRLRVILVEPHEAKFILSEAKMYVAITVDPSLRSG